MSYQITNAKGFGTSLFFIGDETGALYVALPHGRMLCVDANGTRQTVGHAYRLNQGSYTQVKVGQTLKIEVGK